MIHHPSSIIHYPSSIMASFWCDCEVILKSFSDNFGIILGSCWGHFGVTLGSSLDHFGIMLGSLWGHFGVTFRGAGNQVSFCFRADLRSHQPTPRQTRAKPAPNMRLAHTKCTSILRSHQPNPPKPAPKPACFSGSLKRNIRFDQRPVLYL